MPMFGVNNIHMPDGRLLGEVLEEIKNGVTGGKSVDLKDYAKASEVKEVKDLVEQLIADLKAGKYSVGNVEEIKEDKKAVKEEKSEK
jgi:uncharacterized protein (DUF2141 family)